MHNEATEQKSSPDGAPQHPPQQIKRSQSIRILIWLTVLAAFGVVFWVVLQQKPPATSSRHGRHSASGPVSVTTQVARTGSIGVYLDSIGTVTPVYTTSITSQVAGQIAAVQYREGQMVRKGQPLIQIDPRPYAAQLATAQGNLQRDQALLAQAQMDLARYQAAWARQAIARQTLDDQGKIVQQYQGTVKADTGTVQYDTVQLGFCNIVSPISGRVGLRLVDPGNVVQAGETSPLAVVAQTQPITVVFTIAEDSVGQVEDQLRRGRTALETDAYDRSMQTKIATGKLLSLDNQIDTTTGTLKLRALFPNTDYKLYPNLFVNIRLLVQTLENVTLVPDSTIQHNADRSFVFVIAGGRAKMVDVKAGASDGGVTEVTGVNGGEVLADSSFQRLTNNSQVVVSHAPVPVTHFENDAP